MRRFSYLAGIVGFLAIGFAIVCVPMFKAPPLNRIIYALSTARDTGLSQQEVRKVTADAEKARIQYSEALSRNYQIILGLCGALFLTSLGCFLHGRPPGERPNQPPEPTSGLAPGRGSA